MKKEVLKEKIVKILEGINEPVKTNYEIADQILELLKFEKEKWLEKIDKIIDDNNDLLIRWQKEELKDEIKKNYEKSI